MHYRITFAGHRIGAAHADPITVEVPDTIAGAARNSDLTRRIRERAVAALLTVHPDAVDLTQVLADTDRGEGTVYFGGQPVATMMIQPIG